MKKFLLILLILPLIFGACVQPSPDLTTFLETDKTEEISYTDEFKCLQFAEMVYFNAREEGLKVGIVIVFLESSHYGKKSHALNVFNTNDELVFIDCSVGQDAIAYIEIGEPYYTSHSKIAKVPRFRWIVSDYRIIWE